MLTGFYRDAFGLPVIEEIKDEWAALAAGNCEIGLHRAGKGYHVFVATSARLNNNSILVLAVGGDLEELRRKLSRTASRRAR